MLNAVEMLSIKKEFVQLIHDFDHKVKVVCDSQIYLQSLKLWFISDAINLFLKQETCPNVYLVSQF